MSSTRLVPKVAVPFLIAAWCCAPAAAEPAASGGPKMLIHGNYCGPGNNAPLPPIDALDAACARHDACTPSGGLPSAACNLRLQQEAERVARDPGQADEVRDMADLVAATATLIPSAPGPRRPPAAPSLGAGRGAYVLMPAPGPEPMPDPADDDADE